MRRTLWMIQSRQCALTLFDFEEVTLGRCSFRAFDKQRTQHRENFERAATWWRLRARDPQQIARCAVLIEIGHATRGDLARAHSKQHRKECCRGALIASARELDCLHVPGSRFLHAKRVAGLSERLAAWSTPSDALHTRARVCTQPMTLDTPPEKALGCGSFASRSTRVIPIT